MKDENLLFSIIVTTYNNEKTIEKTLTSIIDQNIDEERYEIIVVDDCSSDSTINCIKKIERQNIELIILDKNTGGPSIPRNTGVSHAKGEYIYFLDGDDWLEKDILLKIERNKNIRKSDVIVGKVIKYKNGNESVHARFMNIREYTNEAPLKIPYLYYYLGPAGKFIKRTLIKKYKIEFMKNARFGEDKLFFMKVFEKAKKVSTLSDVSTYLNRSTENESIVKRVNFIEKRKSDIIFFNEVLKIKIKK
ncbi:glycosyltransferase family 2 protein [Staphylococcus felis]|uniref:glycosyltransferase family 2 protein n=1 Tax=Staphylococcus felis TaxID=46127 RepID=UPI0024814A3F|nr:glycosyltransferase family A protein [Staphylococcus felis]